ncbi:3-oxoacyl-[acyl-carrier protein] reductase [Paramicrobacterium humi]|uniref:3-oxoacyl-[acyl-carrier protein] reductase n=1 Tax=Paramicrobacterium humi TaxID=640635 RepID=A0A1H4KZF2_9MICO|nr:SDR family oxidoreductase [Microbacterium humi]SEB63833.1 3-oxoacyl-[acyl-carrier protein] reductase [Microbacterium humi]
MDLQLRGKTAFVAASTGGLGRATAEALAHEGANVVITGRRRETAEQIAAALPSAIGLELDVLDAASRTRALEQARDAFGLIDILVLNGPGPKPGTAADMTADGARTAFEQLVEPHRQLVSETLPGMRERGWGRILAVGSSGIVSPLPNLAASNLGRAALANYLKTLSTEVAADGVTVNLLLPGRIATDRVANLDAAQAERQGLSRQEVEQRSQQSIPAGRYGEPAEFGAAAAFLCSGPASYVTGVALRCDGGLVGTL